MLPVSHISFFVDVVDKIIENFVKTVYFPTWYIYIIMLIITDASVLRELVKAIKEDKTKWVNTFNFAYFFIFQFLFFLIVRMLSTNNINIFSQKEIYSNSLLLSIIQISSYLFWIRIGIKIIIFIINKLSSFEFKTKAKEETNKEETDLKNDINIINDIAFTTDNTVTELNNNNGDIISNSYESNINLLTDISINTPVDSSYTTQITTDIDNQKDNNIIDILDNKEEIEIIDLNLEKEDDIDNYFDDFYN